MCLILVKKASKQLAVSKPLGCSLTKQGKIIIYNSFITSNFNYCPVVWHFCSVASTNKMEKIQERALRFINNDFTSSLKNPLVMSNTSSLHVRRMKTISSEVYKIVNNLSPSYIQDLVQVKVSNYDFRNEHTAVVPKVRTTRYGTRSFRFEAARIWNSLPNEIGLVESYPQFWRLLRAWDGLGCDCPVCAD